MSDLDDYNYKLPEQLIAQQPTANRADARLMLVDRAAGTVSHHHVRDLPEILKKGDMLVTNESKVVPARIFGTRVQTGGRVEILYLNSDESGMWRVLVKARGRLQPKEAIMLQDNQARDTVKLWLLERGEAGSWIAHLEEEHEPLALLQKIGRLPLPPYIRDGMESDDDRDRYQTVYAKTPGSVAAPTAGLHFTKELLSKLSKQGIERHSVTLHVGLDTFKPISVDKIDEHPMHSEWGQIDAETAWALQQGREANRRIVAVGTTSVRVLESAAKANGGTLREWADNTRLFIHPPYKFLAVDALMTNFHLPRTTLLLLVSAFAGKDLIKHAYQVAIREQYRFFSYGDTMLIV